MSDFIGDNGSDELFGLGEDDMLKGLGGADTLSGGAGNDTLKGGGGDDTLTGGDDNDTLVGGKGADIMDGGEGSDLYRFVTSDAVSSDTYADTGTSGTDTLDATLVTHLRLGDDFDASTGMDVILGDEDGGTAIFGSGLRGADWDFTTMELRNISLISGSGHDDHISGSDGDDTIRGIGGEDTLYGGAGSDLLIGNGGDDSLYGGAGEDVVKGGGGDDILYGGAGDDVLRGGGGGDLLDGGGGDDELLGGGGDDILVVDPDADDVTRVDGEGGEDTLRMAGFGQELDITGTGGDVYASIEVIDLSNHGNTLVLDKDSVRDLSDESNTVRIIGGTQDAVQALGLEWTVGSDVEIGGTTYNTYSIGGVTLQIESGINQAMINTVGNDPVTADDDAISLNEDESTANLVATLLAGDVDPDTGDVMRITSAGLAGKGTVTFNAGTAAPGDEILSYAADGAVLDALGVGESTTDTFSYTVSDIAGETDTATVTVTIHGVNDAVDAVNDAIAVDEDAATANLMTSLRGNDTDADTGDTPDIIAVTQGTKGVVTFNDSGTPTDSTDDTLTYTADGAVLDALGVGESTTDTFTYTLDDGHGSTDTATVTVTINGVNDGPTAVDDVASVDEDETTANLLGIIGLQSNDTDPDTSDTPDIIAVTQGAKGSVIFDDNGTPTDSTDDTLTYTADGAVLDVLGVGESTTDTFTYTMDDGNGGTDTATVTVTINGVDDGPTAGDDFITLGNGNDTLDSLAGNDTINGGLGNDTLNGGADNDTVNGDDGDDILSGDAGNDAINGGNGIDTVDFTGAATGVTLNLVTGSSNGDGTDTVTGIENIIGSINNDTFTGDDNDNVITGGDGDDGITGGLGNDILNDGAGHDSIAGDDGDDTIFASAGNDILSGGAGIDTVDFSNSAVVGGIDITLSAGGASPTSDGTDTLSGFENITGSAFDDAINGDALNNVINGGAGIDILDGSAGNDTLNGGLGDDLLTGGGGDDTFVFDSALSAGMVSNVDAIAVFEGAGAVGGDVIALDDAMFTTLTGGFTANNFVSAASAPTAADADDFILYDQSTGALFYDADGNGGGAAVQFATLQDLPTGLAFDDFTII